MIPFMMMMNDPIQSPLKTKKQLTMKSMSPRLHRLRFRGGSRGSLASEQPKEAAAASGHLHIHGILNDDHRI
jgi:hypothetical protein